MSVRAFGNLYCAQCNEVTLHRYERCIHCDKPCAAQPLPARPTNFNNQSCGEAARRVRALTRRSRGRAAPAGEINGRQLEVARLAAQGLSHKAIARELNTSYGNITTYISRACEKLGIDRGKESLVAWLRGRA